MIDCNVLQLRGTPGGFIGTEFGYRLFGHLYEAASAYMIQNSNGEGELCLFDTTFAREVLKRPWPDGAVFALYSNHPEGNLSPTVTARKSCEKSAPIPKQESDGKWRTATMIYCTECERASADAVHSAK